jgi:hypothetical protein
VKHTELRIGSKGDVMHRNNIELIWIRSEVKIDIHRNIIKHAELRKEIKRNAIHGTDLAYNK